MREKLLKVLVEAYQTLKQVEVDIVDSDKDIVTEGDLAIGTLIQNELKSWEEPMQIITEEFSAVGNPGNYYAFVDELDGTDNAFRAVNILPSVTLIQIAKPESTEIKFSDFILCAGVEHASGQIFIAELGKGVEKYQIKQDGTLEKLEIVPKHPKKPVIITDLYSMAMKGEMDIAEVIISNYQTKDFGASAATYLWVATGLFEAYVSSGKKGHELPLFYLLCKENGVKMTDFNDNSYDEIKFDFYSTDYRFIAGTDEVHGDLLDKLKALLEK